MPRLNQLAYSPSDVALFRSMIGSRPQRILGDSCIHVVFDYSNWHIRAFPEDFAAASQNEYDEAIQIRLTKYEDSYVVDPTEKSFPDKVLVAEQEVRDILILRTVVYFSDHQEFKSPKEAMAKNPISTGNKEYEATLRDLVSRSVGGHEELMCNPASTESAALDPGASNLVDAGLIFDLGDDMLVLYPEYNSFQCMQCLLKPQDVLGRIGPDYQLVSLNDAT